MRKHVAIGHFFLTVRVDPFLFLFLLPDLWNYLAFEQMWQLPLNEDGLQAWFRFREMFLARSINRNSWALDGGKGIVFNFGRTLSIHKVGMLLPVVNL